MCSSVPKISGYFLSHLDEEHFSNDEGKETYSVIKKYVARKGNPPAFKLLIEDLKLTTEAREFLSEANIAPKTKEDCEQTVETLNTYKHVRTFYYMCKSGLEKLQGKKIDIEELTSMAEKGLASMRLDKSVEEQMFHMGKDSNMDDLMENLIYGEDDDRWIPTGFKTFDIKNGGMPRGGMCTVGANSGAGKSHFLLQLAKNQAAMGYKVVIVPLEMTEDEEATRLLANLSQTDSLRISLRTLTDDEKDAIWRKYRRFNKLIAGNGGRLTIYRPKSDVNIEETMAAVHSYDPDVVYIDYIGLLKGSDGDDQWRQLGNIARYGKVYASNHGKSVCMAAQVDDDGRVRYSQAIKEHSDLALVFVATKETKDAGYLNISMIKGRNQANFDFCLKISYATSTIRDLEPNELDQMDPTDKAASKAEKNAAAKKKAAADKSYMPDLDN